MVGPKRTCGFTLVELLVVIGIIGVLITLLVPTVSRATAMVREHATRVTITELGTAVEAFKSDFGVCPPSKPYVAGDLTSGRRDTGAANLAYYLLGPGRSGWGLAGGGLMPFSNARPSRSYGPHFKAAEDAMRFDDRAGRKDEVVGFLDAYTPPGIILYFAGRPDTTGDVQFHWLDGGSNHDGGRKNYASDEYFKQCVVQTMGKGATAPKRYLRQDYYLVSPGLDGRYGAIVRNKDTGEWGPTDLNAGGSQCDDIGNWKRPMEK
ncbi:MAG: hypothetical protein AMK72_04985 [Planctomycetes bacterium SM23_25]|nr:MAG: hypothetical protein AMS14_04330 [Planctomycetes bacterium DG_20]KPK49273.1 MAG: hypothetical protein AMK72_04985 [Planctomycetes bacterium SM23_25]